ncbi:hypothetical protein L3Q82_020585, partial [Scortum barcoo]
MRMFSYRDPRHQRLVVVAKDNGEPALSATVTIKLSTVETAVKAYSDMTEVPLEYDIFSDLNLYLVIGLGSVSFLLLITILVTIVLKCQKPKPSKAAPPCRNSVISERNSTIADSTLVSNDAYWYSLFLAETRKGKLVVRQPVPKGSRYIVSSIPRGTGLTDTSDSAASTLQSPVNENIKLDTVIAVVSVSDKDSGDNGVVDLHIPDNMPFKLRESSDNYYELVVSEPLDREKVPEYDITFTVTDRGSPPLSDNETMTLELLDVNDNVPQFPQSFYTIRVMENNQPGALLSSLTAFDPDLHENQYLVYFILEKEIANTSMSMLFSINPENGNLYALKTFDYEIEKEFLFHIEARDSGSPPLSSNVTVHIIIVDQNDNAPVIVSPWRAHGSVVEEKIPRSTDKGSLVAKVIALDTDSVHNSRITYQFLQVTDATLFSLDQYNGEIRTMRMFSYRDPRHQRLVVVAKDNGEPALSATVTIKLSTVETAVKAYSDMTEVPLEYDIFSDLNLYLVIGLGSVSFLLLITILVTIVLKCQKPKPSKAAPPCRNSVISERNSTIADSTLVSNDAYWYSLFLAETRKGKLVVRQPVPKGSRYIVSSIPRGTGLTDTSDSAASTLQSPVNENIKLDTVIAVVSVSDKDSGDNGVVDLHIPDNMPFKLRESSDNYYELVVSEPLDREKVPEYDITFTVTDRGSPPLSDNETMTLELLDVNDNVPQFPQSFYTIRVMENNQPGALLSSLTAFDPDLHENQYLVYFILEKEIANTSMSMLFSINPENGNLYALKTFDYTHQRLDHQWIYEIEKEFLFHIEARDSDSGSPPLSSNVTVHIIIVDQNDNAPVIVSPWRAHGSVVEEKIPRSTDKALILIILSNRLSLVAKVIALDTDSVHNSRITYQFLQVTETPMLMFSLDQYNGEIRTMRMFSYRDPCSDPQISAGSLSLHHHQAGPRQQRLVVVAKDNGEPALSATCPVTIKLTYRLRFHSGLFHPMAHYEIEKVSNDAYWRPTLSGGGKDPQIGSLVAKVIALDTDSLSDHLPVSQDNGEPALSATVTIKLSTVETAVKAYSDMTEKNGNLYALKTFDYEIEKEFLFHIEARDSGSPPLSSNVTVHIIIVDQNDNAPVIVSPWRAHGSVVEEKIPRSTDKGSLVAKVIALDTDSVHNSRITYQFLQVTDATLFSLDQYNGEIRTMRMFSYRDPRHQRLVVVAKDNGEPALSATVTIKLSTVETAVKAYSDMTEVPLEYDIFSDLNLYLVIGLGSVSFLLLITILVTIVLKCQKPKPSKAAPPCRNSVISERNSTIADSTLVSNDAYWYSLFLAETRKGKLVVRQPVPKGSRYIVSSIPRGTGLTDTSDSAASTLQFPQSFYTIRVMENNQPGALLSSLTAFDPDLHENQYLVYFILEKEIANTSMSMLFSINPENGNLYALKTFDYEIEKEFLFHIEARDSGSPPLSSNVTVHIIIVDQNDNAPVIVSPHTDSVHNSRITYQFLQVTDATLFSLDQYNGEIRTMRMFSYRDPRHQRLVVVAKDNGEPALSATVTIKLSTVETAVKAYSDMTEVPLEYDIFSDLNLYLVIGLGSVSFLLLITILVTIVLKCQKPKPSKAAPPCRNSVISERNSTIADSTLVSNDAYWYSLFLAETRKGKLVVRQPVPKGSRYIVSSIPRGTGLTDTSDSAASTLQWTRNDNAPVIVSLRGERTAQWWRKRSPDPLIKALWLPRTTGSPALSATVTIKLSTVETAVKAYSDMTEVPLEYDIFSDLNLYLVIGLGSVSFLLLITILVTIVLKCQKPKPSKAAPPCRNSVISERNSTIADSTLVSNDAYWYSLFLAETRKGKLVVRQPVPKGSRYIVSSIPRGTGLTDTSDSAASTLQSFYTIRVMENNQPGALLSSLTAFDPDLHENQYLVYFILEKEIANTSMSMLFSINPENGNLYALKTFDYEIEKEFLFHIEARDSGSPPLSITIKLSTVETAVKAYSDMTEVPLEYDIFSDLNLYLVIGLGSVSFLLLITILVTIVIALDTDSVHNSRITYQFLQVTDATLFSLDQYKRRDPDYEDVQLQRSTAPASGCCCLRTTGSPALSATVTIKLSTVETAVKAYSDMTEVPLEYDIFSDLNLYLVIGLGSVSFLLLITILVTIVLKCQKPKPSKAAPPCRNSVISERNSTIADSTLVSNDAYWYSLFLAETRKGKLVVRQPVPKGSRYIVSSIPRGTGLTDTSDSAASTLQEELKLGTAVGNVAKDLGLDLGRLADRNLRVVSGTKQELFKVNPRDGVLFVNQRVDREELCAKTAPCITNLKAVVENPLEMHQVIVEILDLNDNAPRFPEENHTLEVLESAIVGSRFQMEGAHDLDVGLNSLQSYKLNHNQYFRLETEEFGEDGKVPFLILQRPLDREQAAQHWLLLTATDGGKPSKSGTINITVVVSDINDNSPVCDKQKYTITIRENAPAGTFLLTVNASDLDEGVNGEIEYSLRSKLRGLSSEPFDLDSKTGKLTVKGGLDYEEKQVYEIKVLAADRGAVSLSTHCNVVVRVEDVNDNRPEIDITSLSSRIPEDAPPGTVVALMGVTDLDSGVNGQVVCSVPGDLPFDLKPSPDGQSYSLVTKDYLDKERIHMYDIPITAKDLGSPALSSTKVIQVDVLDVNDNSPLFTESPYTFYVPENNKAGLSIFSVSATDADGGENAAVTYTLNRKSPETTVTSFLNINEANGTISALKSFDFETLKTFQFQVVATDSGTPSLSSNVTVNVFILDQNDNAPVILYPVSSNGSAEGVEEIPLNVNAGHLVTKVRAYDADIGYNGWLLFSLQEVTDHSLFGLDRYTGQIRTLRSFTETDEAEHKLLLIL